MASVTDLLKQAQKFSIDNSPLILTVTGAAGVVATGLLAAKGGFRAAQVLENERAMRSVRRTGHDDAPVTITNKERLALTWKYYAPACGVGLFTVGSVVMANQIGTRRAAAMAAAVTLSEKAFTEYREKMVEKLGPKKEELARSEIAQDRFNENSEKASSIIITNGKQLCHDGYSSRYFESTMEDLKAAMNRVNHKINNNDYASLSDFYDFLGLEHTQTSDDVGWNVDKLLDINFHAVIGPEGKPAISMEYRTEPIRDFFRLC